MKKKLVIIYSVIIVVVLLTASLFIPVTQINSVTIEANFYNVLAQLNHPGNWIKWQSSLKINSGGIDHSDIKTDSSHNSFSIKTPVTTFTVNRLTPVSFEVEEKIKNKSSLYALAVESTTLPKKTNVITAERKSLFDYIFKNDNSAFQTAKDLKSYIDDPVAYYGYSLTIQPVIDTIVLVTEKKMDSANWRKEVSNMHHELYAFMRKNDLKQLQPKIISFKNLSEDTLLVRVGVAVDKTVKATKEIECRTMPKGKMLVGEYQGPFNKRSSLSSSIEKYIIDHAMDRVATPWERYLSDSLPATDTSFVKLKMYYPVL